MGGQLLQPAFASHHSYQKYQLNNSLVLIFRIITLMLNCVQWNTLKVYMMSTIQPILRGLEWIPKM